jgi:hypothetical protein
MSLQFLVELIHNMHKCFIHYETHVAIAILSHYLFNHVVLNFMLIRLKVCSISIGPFIDTFQRLHEF